MRVKLSLEGKTEKWKKVCKIFNYSAEYRIIYKECEVVPEGITYITGPSGAGKTTLAKQLAEKYGYSELELVADENKEIIDLIDESLEETLYLLNSVGLSDVPVYLAKYKDLSIGQKCRFDIAYNVSRGKTKLYIDEFCSYLDRASAKTCAYNLHKLCMKRKISILAVTAHSDLQEYLQPDIIVEIKWNNKVLVKKLNYITESPFLSKLSVREGRFEDYLELEKFHYCDDVDNKYFKEYGGKIHSLYFKNQLIGIILYVCPYQLEYAEQEEEFEEINSLLSCSYRVIIHPSFRGIGLTKYFFEESYKLLGKKYVYTFAAMAAYNPFYEKAGFYEIEDINYTHEIEYQLIQNYLNNKNSVDKEILLDNAVMLLGKVMHRWYCQYCNIIGKNINFNEEDFEELYSGVYDVDDLEMLLEELEYISMKHYVYTRKDE